MSSQFDEYIERRGTGSIKWDRRPGLDPFWVADLDFRSPQPIIDVLKQRSEFGVFGYAHAHDGLEQAIIEYAERRFSEKVESSHLVHIGGLVPALSLACQAIGQPGDAVMTHSPVYYPFLSVANDQKMSTIAIPQIQDTSGNWTFNWDLMEAQVTPQTKIFILCSPQNPLGRVFSKDEISRLADFCERHDLILVSDEVHEGLIYNLEATPFFSGLHLPESFRKRLIVLNSPSKTYNIAGLAYAYAIIFDDSLRRKFVTAKKHTQAEINTLSFYAAEAAYREPGCEIWRQELVYYLQENYQTLRTFVDEKFENVKMPNMTATYLAWLDFTQTSIANPAKFFEEKCGIYLSDGAPFGKAGCCRINFGCPKDRLCSALEKMASAFQAAKPS